MTPPPSTPGSTALVTLLSWAFILIGAIGLPVSLISGAMVATRAYGTQNADAAGFITVVLGPAAVLVCGIGLLRHWTCAWWGALLLALLVFAFSMKDSLRKPAPPFTYISETGTKTTVYSSGGGIATLAPLLISGGVLVLLLLPSVRGPFRLSRSTEPPAAAEPAVLIAGEIGAGSECSAIQQEILAALRAGAEFRTAHKEGGTTIRWQRGRFIREDYGDWSERADYTEEAEFLAFLWRFFEWESRGFQRVEMPDAERWENIRKLLHSSTPGTNPASHAAGGHRPLAIFAALVIAGAAVALVTWLRGGIHWRTGARHEQTPQKLDTFDGKPPQVKQPEFKVPRS